SNDVRRRTDATAIVTPARALPKNDFVPGAERFSRAASCECSLVRVPSPRNARFRLYGTGVDLIVCPLPGSEELHRLLGHDLDRSITPHRCSPDVPRILGS